MGDRDLEILRLIDEGTASETGVAYLRALVRRLAQALDARYAFVSRFSPDYETVEALAFLSGDDLIDDVRYPLKGSPCERVLEGEIVAYDRDVCELFPAERDDLEAMGAVAYLAIPLRRPDGRVLGHLATIATAERNWSERDFGILRIFAARATAELERQEAEQSLVNANAELARRADLESLITSISTRFVTLEADDIDRAIETSLGEVAEFARSERARVFRHSEDGNAVHVTHEWVAPGVEPALSKVSRVLREDAPAVFAHFMRNEVLLVPRREDLDGEFGVLRDLMRRQGVRSTIIVPMVNGNRPVGAIAFHSLHHEQSWAPQDVRLLRLLGEIIAGATVRKEQELALRHRLELERQIAEISTRFVSATPTRMDEEVDHALRVIGKLIGSDRGVLFRLDEGGEKARLANEWTAPGVPSVRDRVHELSRREFPEVIEHFMRRDTLNSAQPEQLPQGFGKLNDMLKGVPVRSRIAVPVVDANRVLGFLGFHSLATERHWLAEDVRLLGLLGEIVGSAFARREAETALEQARDAALGASRAKSEFLASMSHELRTPLNGILGYAQLLRRDPTLASAHGDRVAAIERCGEHLLTLIGEVLDLAKIESGRLELEPAPFALDDLLRDLADIARVRAAQAGLTFRFETSGDLPEVLMGDERRLRQILLNLLGNAVKFTPKGNVCFSVRGRPEGAAQCALRFEIEDTGVGIPAEEMPKIFDPFHQVRQDGRHVEGTGLGLAICHRLTSLMGGRLDARSRPGEGSLFAVEVVLPRSGHPVRTSRNAEPRVIGYAGPRRRLLVVDDKIDNRQVLGSFLRSLGFDVDEAEDGHAALEAARRQRPSLVFMDLVMPGLDGFEAIRRLRADPAQADLRVVALSASAFDTTRAQSLAAGCDAFLSKPLRLEQVLEVLGQELDLEWRHEGRTASSALQAARRASSDTIGLLPEVMARELYGLAMEGDVRQLMRRLDEMRREPGGLDEAIDALQALGRDFDMGGLRAVLRPLTGVDA